jgi:hypothetical protein
MQFAEKPSPDVDLESDRLHVVGVDTSPDTTKMIDLATVRNCPARSLVGKAMGKDNFAVNLKLPIPITI